MVSVILGSMGKSFFSHFFFFLNKKRTTTSMKEHANNTISDEAFAKRHEQWSSDTPDTKEAYLIREIFHGRIHVLPIQNPSDLRLFFLSFWNRPFPLENGRSDCSSVNCLNLVPSFYSTHPPFFSNIIAGYLAVIGAVRQILAVVVSVSTTQRTT